MLNKELQIENDAAASQHGYKKYLFQTNNKGSNTGLFLCTTNPIFQYLKNI